MPFQLPKVLVSNFPLLINQSVIDLYNKIIVPIDAMRSFSAPSKNNSIIIANQNNSDALVKKDFQSLNINLKIPLESRIHCFYRLMGFPAIISESNNKFYDSGFNFENTDNNLQSLSIDQDQKIFSILEKRENYYQNLQKIFTTQTQISSIYSLLLLHPRKFNILTSELQNQHLSSREKELKYLQQFKLLQPYLLQLKNSQNLDFVNISHFLKPLLVHPRIASTIFPDTNQILSLFSSNLTGTTAKIANQNLLKSVLEDIILRRLTDSQDNQIFLKNFQKVLSQDQSSTELSVQELKTSLLLLSNNDKINSSLIQSLLVKFNSVELEVIEQLTQTLLFLTNQLVIKTTKIAFLRNQIDWLPVVNTKGSEFLATPIKIILNDSINSLELQILHLQTLIIQSENSNSFSNNDFYFSNIFYDLNIRKELDQRMNDLKKQKRLIFEEIAQQASEIEMISGEVSGLGLMDIITIYLSCWSVDLIVLLSLLDSKSLERLQNNFPNLKSKVNSLLSTKLNLNQALSKIENQMINIFSFIDKQIEKNHELQF